VSEQTILGLFVVVTFAAGFAIFVLGAATLAPTIATDILALASSPWLAAVGLSVFQIGVFVIAALLTITIVQSLTAMMRDWLDRLHEDHRPALAIVSYSEPSHVTARRQKLLWGFAAGLIVVALGVTAVLNHKTMVTLVDSEQTEVLAHRGFIQGGVENTLPALQAAARAGADRVEFDVLETKDASS
jgi:glycerophosphoryl diester phosphodiesterase